MSVTGTTRPFAYNPSLSPISGTTEYGDIVVGDINTDYSSDYGGLKWWGGPLETDYLGYVIGNARPSGQPVPPGVVGTGSVGFWRSKYHTDQSFLDLANYIGAKNGQPPFATTADAENWLQSNGYYTSFNLPTPTPTVTQTGTASVTPTPTVTPTQTITRTPTRTPAATPTPTPTSYTPNSYLFYRPDGGIPQAPQNNGDLMLVDVGNVVTYNPNDSVEIVFTAIDKSGTSHPQYNDLLTYGGAITLTQGSNTYTASGDSGFFNYTVNPGFPSYYTASYLDVIQSSANPFVSGVTIFLTASVFYPVTPTPTETQIPTPSITPTQTLTPTTTSTPTPSVTNTQTPTNTTTNTTTTTPTPSITATQTVTPTPSITPTQTLTPTTTTTPTPTPTEPYFLLFEDSSIATAENNDNIEIDVI